MGLSWGRYNFIILLSPSCLRDWAKNRPPKWPHSGIRRHSYPVSTRNPRMTNRKPSFRACSSTRRVENILDLQNGTITHAKDQLTQKGTLPCIGFALLDRVEW